MLDATCYQSLQPRLSNNHCFQSRFPESSVPGFDEGGGLGYGWCGKRIILSACVHKNVSATTATTTKEILSFFRGVAGGGGLDVRDQCEVVPVV
jgi:hypothetical protein